MSGKYWLSLGWLALFQFIQPHFLRAAQISKDQRVIETGSVVSLQYSLSGEDGKVIESTKAKAPIKYTHGANQLIPGLEQALAGMTVGEEKHVRLKPEDAYGLFDPNAFREIPKDQLPADGLKIGAVLATQGPRGEIVAARVHKIKETTVVLDMNHPMAGRTLIFDVKIADIQPPADLPAKSSEPVDKK